MGLFKFLLGGEARRNAKKLDSLADKVISLEPKYKELTDEELKAQTQLLKDRLAKGETLDDILVDVPKNSTVKINNVELVYDISEKYVLPVWKTEYEYKGNKNTIFTETTKLRNY